MQRQLAAKKEMPKSPISLGLQNADANRVTIAICPDM